LVLKKKKKVEKMAVKPFSIQASRVAKARPFRTVQDVRHALQLYHSGGSIGFTRKASLVAMGLLPRSDGTYRLSQKYSLSA
jgi:hypothetical protein